MEERRGIAEDGEPEAAAALASPMSRVRSEHSSSSSSSSSVVGLGGVSSTLVWERMSTSIASVMIEVVRCFR